MKCSNPTDSIGKSEKEQEDAEIMKLLKAFEDECEEGDYKRDVLKKGSKNLLCSLEKIIKKKPTTKSVKTKFGKDKEVVLSN